MNKMNIVAAVLLSSSLCAHKEVVREIARDIQQSDYQSTKVHLGRLKREDLSQEKRKSITKELKEYAKEVRKNKEGFVTISNSWVDSLTALGGLLLSAYGIKSGFSPQRLQRLLDEDEYEGYGYAPASLSSKALGVVEVALGAYMAYNGYKCWYQNKCVAIAQKVEKLLDDTYSEVKEG